MYSIKIIRSFAGAHYLKGYQGKCENLHGHNWKVEAEWKCRKLDKTGISVDFTIAKRELDNIIKKFDHTLLNEHPAFKKDNPSAENIARYIFTELKKRFKNSTVSSVTVWESDNASATYSEG